MLPCNQWVNQIQEGELEGVYSEEGHSGKGYTVVFISCQSL